MHLIYTFHDSAINYFIDNESLVQDSALDQVKSFLERNPRAPHMIQRDSPVSKEIHRLLSQNIAQVKRMGVQIKDPQFYEEKLGNKI